MNTIILQPTRRLVAMLAMLAFAIAWPLQLSQPDIAVEDARGTGWASFAVCVGCGVGAVGIMAGGLGAMLVAVNTPAGGIAAAGCIAACHDAIN